MDADMPVLDGYDSILKKSKRLIKMLMLSLLQDFQSLNQKVKMQSKKD